MKLINIFQWSERAPRSCLCRCLALLSLVALMPLAACSAALSTLEVESARTTGLVMTALVNDAQIGARPINVRVTRGVVRLSGLVRSEAEVARAIALASAVPGVTRVDSSLRIGADLPPEPSLPAGGQPAVRDPAIEFAELDATAGRLAIGGSVGLSRPAASGFESVWSVSPLVRFGSGSGLALTAMFDWHGVSVAAEPESAASRLRVRPIMVGLGYTVVAGRVAISPSVVGGYAFNRIIVPSTGAAGRLAVDADNSLVWRPGLSIWVDAGRRTVANLSVGRVLTHLNMTFVDAGVIDRRPMKGNATTVSVGLAYWLF